MQQGANFQTNQELFDRLIKLTKSDAKEIAALPKALRDAVNPNALDPNITPPAQQARLLQDANAVFPDYEKQMKARDAQKNRTSSVEQSDNKVQVLAAGGSFQVNADSKYDLSSNHAKRAKTLMESKALGPLGVWGGIIALLVMKLMNNKVDKTEQAFESAVTKLNTQQGLNGRNAYTITKDTSGAAPRFIIKNGNGDEITDAHQQDLVKLLKNEGIAKGINLNFSGIAPAAPAGNALAINARPMQANPAPGPAARAAPANNPF